MAIYVMQCKGNFDVSIDVNAKDEKEAKNKVAKFFEPKQVYQGEIGPHFDYTLKESTVFKVYKEKTFDPYTSTWVEKEEPSTKGYDPETNTWIK